jgi:hypothetical protein
MRSNSEYLAWLDATGSRRAALALKIAEMWPEEGK